MVAANHFQIVCVSPEKRFETPLPRGNPALNLWALLVGKMETATTQLTAAEYEQI